MWGFTCVISPSNAIADVVQLVTWSFDEQLKVVVVECVGFRIFGLRIWMGGGCRGCR